MIPRYRGWDTRKKIMYSPEEMGRDGLTLSPDGEGFVNISGLSTKLNQYCKHILPLQSLGFNDKNGTEVFKGDVVRWVDTEGRLYIKQVNWNKKNLCWNIGNISYLTLVGSGYFQTELEAIGNIHANPELLEGDK